GKTILVLGGWGLVGSSVCRRLIAERPSRIIVTSLNEAEARHAAEQFEKETELASGLTFVPWWGNIFARHDERTTPREELLADPTTRRRLITDIIDDLSEELLAESALY